MRNDSTLIWVILAHVGTEIAPARVVRAFSDGLHAVGELEKLEAEVAKLLREGGGWKEGWEEGQPVLEADSAFYDIPGDRRALRSLGLPTYGMVSTLLVLRGDGRG